MIFHPDDICSTCGHAFRDHGYYEPTDPQILEEPFRFHIDCKKIIGEDENGYSLQCECCNFTL